MLLAQAGQGIDIGKEWQLSGQSGHGFTSLADIVSNFLPKILLVGGIIFFVMVIMAGFSILSGAGSGDEKALVKWQQILAAGAVGLIIMIGSFWALQIINFISGGSLKGLLGS